MFVKRKEISMTQPKILESHGFFIVLLLHSAILPPSLWFGDLLSQLFVQCFEAFYDGKFVVAFFKFNKNVNVCCSCVVLIGINWQSLIDKRVF